MACSPITETLGFFQLEKYAAVNFKPRKSLHKLINSRPHYEVNMSY